MKKAIYVIIIFLLLSICVYSNQIKEYEADLVKFFDTTDRGKEAVGFSKADNGIAGCGPHCFTISDEDIIYVCDPCNYRIAKYNINLNYLSEIKNRDSIYANRIKVSDNNEIYLICSDFEILKMNSTGSIIYTAYGNQISSRLISDYHMLYK